MKKGETRIFYTEQTVDVTVDHDDIKINCTLTFGGMRLPELRVNEYSPAITAFLKGLSDHDKALSCSAFLESL